MIVLCGLLLVVVFSFWGLAMLAPSPSYEIINLDGHWDALRPDGSTEDDILLSDFNFGTVEIGAVYELRNKLPDTEVPAGALQVRTAHATIEVLLDGERIYTDGTQYPIGEKMTPIRFHFVPLPPGYAGRAVTLRIASNEYNAFSALEPVMIGNTGDLRMEYIREGRLTLAVNLFLCVIGVILFFIYIYLWVNYRREDRIFFSGLISFLIGLYMLCYYDLIDFLTPGVDRNSTIEFAVLFLIPFALSSFMASTSDGKVKRFCIILSAFNLLFALVAFVLHATGVMLISGAVTPLHLLMVIEGVGLPLIALIRFLRVRRREQYREDWRFSQTVWLGGFFTLILSGLIDLIRYNLHYYLGQGSSSYSNLNILTVGVLVFVGTLIINFFYYHIEQLFEEDVLRRLSGLAFTDTLTNVSNRSHCEQVMRDMDAAGEPFFVVSMDLDRLKEINDRFGHAEGDQYLADMAAILSRSFGQAALLGRMGGDEFIAIFRGADNRPVRRCLAILETTLVNRRFRRDPVQGSVSYGFALNTECPGGTADETYKLADSRMYAMKKAGRRKEGRHA